MKKFAIITTVIILIGVTVGFLTWYSAKHPHRSKLITKMITKSLETIRSDFAEQSCTEFSQKELDKGYFEALITGYCQPRAENYENRGDFLCAVGLNCSCPAGRSEILNCAVKTDFAWAPCLDFNDTDTEYCHQTASQAKPEPGQIAADWSCFQAKDVVSIDGKDYLVTDKGSAIKGRRFDMWFDNCEEAFQATGIYEVKI